jgi:hypothetical protein
MEPSGNPFQLYENSGYKTERIKKQSVVIDLRDDSVGDSNSSFARGNMTFSVSLQEPLRIDSLCDVYLDNFTTLDALQNTNTDTQAFVIDINEFPIQTNSNNPALFNKLVIPNEDNSATDTATLKIHKGRKMNYICQMNSQTLKTISGSITTMNNANATMDDDNDLYRVIMEFLFVTRVS